MTTTSYTARTDGWMAERGVLLALLQLPFAALVVGHALGLISLPVASFAVFVASAAFPAWVSHRSAVSGNPDEPVHHLHRYAAHAVVVVTAVTIAMTPVLVVAGIEFWHLWYDLGAELTAEPRRGSWSLIAGMVVYGVAATCTVTSYQVLFGRPTYGARRRGSATIATMARRTSSPVPARRREAEADGGPPGLSATISNP